MAVSGWGKEPAEFKVFISADMEGVAGLVSEQQVSDVGVDYAVGRRLMTAEVNSAIEAAFQAGATAVTITDGHGHGTNLLPGEIDRRATLITGSPMPQGMMQGLDQGFAAAIFVGYHAFRSSADGVLAHTFSSALLRVYLNGQEVGEYGLNAAMAGFYGVPVVFVSGDRAVTEEAKAFIPGVETVAVKEGLAHNVARTLQPEEARNRISATVKESLGRRREIAPVRLQSPITLEVELALTSQADNAMLLPGMIRISGTRIRYIASNMEVAYRVSMLIERLAR